MAQLLAIFLDIHHRIVDDKIFLIGEIFLATWKWTPLIKLCTYIHTMANVTTAWQSQLKYLLVLINSICTRAKRKNR